MDLVSEPDGTIRSRRDAVRPEHRVRKLGVHDCKPEYNEEMGVGTRQSVVQNSGKRVEWSTVAAVRLTCRLRVEMGKVASDSGTRSRLIIMAKWLGCTTCIKLARSVCFEVRLELCKSHYDVIRADVTGAMLRVKATEAAGQNSIHHHGIMALTVRFLAVMLGYSNCPHNLLCGRAALCLVCPLTRVTLRDLAFYSLS